MGAKVKDSESGKTEIIDLFRPLSNSCEIEFIYEDDREGIEIFWHSSAHILGYSLEQLYSCLLCTGPVKEHEGFYYDAHFEDENTTISTENLADIQKQVNRLTSQKHFFQRVDISYQQAVDLFKENKFKLELIDKHIQGHDSVSVYKVGDFVDLCEGPHIPHSGYVGEMLIQNQSGSYWKGDVNNPKTQRVHGISFRTKDKLKEWKKLQEEILKRDHRVIGKQQKLFSFESESPGSVAFLPNGAHIYNKLIEYLRKEYIVRGYQEVITPNVFSIDLWKTSGHYENYKDDMFLFKNDDKEFGIKPMNCPGHCLLFSKLVQSYNDLPLRIADFGVLHRNEISGALSGLTRVRRFQQDDSHIFCTEDQIQSEIQNCIKFMDDVYSRFGFDYTLEFSTRPQKKIGSDETWDIAENALTEAIKHIGKPWKINQGDGAFYGPKIDVKIKDLLGRSWQLGTFQLDFQLPARFNLSYKTSDGYKCPVIIHRALLGSLERFIAILTEHTGGRWPFWLNPKQIH